MLNPISFEQWSRELRAALTPSGFAREEAIVQVEQGAVVFAYREITVTVRRAGQSAALTFFKTATGETVETRFSLTHDGVVQAAAAISLSVGGRLPDKSGASGLL